jgi:hypothetical protein
MGSTGARHRSSLATMTYVAQIFFVQFRLILSLRLFCSCIKARPWSLPIFITTSVSHSEEDAFYTVYLLLTLLPSFVLTFVITMVSKSFTASIFLALIDLQCN